MKCSGLQTLARARLARTVMLGLVTLALAPAQALQFNGAVQVSVKLASSSGICGVRTGTPSVGVHCGNGEHTVLMAPGASAYQRVGTIPAFGVVTEPLPVYSDGVKITSWRIVKLDNADYVELTVAW
jgi:hypothetical protein